MIYGSDNILAKLINYYGKIVNVFVVVRGDGRSVVACVGLVPCVVGAAQLACVHGSV